MPSMAVAFQAVSREAVGQASSAINTIQRLAASLGIALLAVVLQRAVEAELPGVDGDIGALAALSGREQAGALDALASAFGTTFWLAVALVASALIPALLLPRKRPSEADAPQSNPTRSQTEGE
jgi:predicted anti-sigma-YlaC factor YlaD